MGSNIIFIFEQKSIDISIENTRELLLKNIALVKFASKFRIGLHELYSRTMIKPYACIYKIILYHWHEV